MTSLPGVKCVDVSTGEMKRMWVQQDEGREVMNRSLFWKRAASWMLSGIALAALHSAADAHPSRAEDLSAFQQVANPGDRDPFPHRAQIRHATGFTLEYHDDYKKIEVLTPWRDARATFTYLLVPHGRSLTGPVPKGAVVVEIPVKRVVMASTTLLTFFPMLGVTDALVGLSGCKLVNTPEVAERIRQGKVEEVGAGGGGMARRLNMELLFALQPDLVLVHSTGIPQYDTHPKLLEAGFKTGIVSNYMEPEPLGRAEWVKFLAAFFNKEKDAEELFSEIEAHYQESAEKARKVENRPRVFCGISQQSTWYLPGGRSYMAAFLRDAGARYLWDDDRSSGIMSLSVENVLERAREADVWLNPGAVLSLDELRGTDERFSLFKAFQKGQVFNNNARIGPGGGNDYWETGVGRPDLILLDLIKIFHPQLAPGHELIWHQRLPLRTGGD